MRTETTNRASPRCPANSRRSLTDFMVESAAMHSKSCGWLPAVVFRVATEDGAGLVFTMEVGPQLMEILNNISTAGTRAYEDVLAGTRRRDAAMSGFGDAIDDYLRDAAEARARVVEAAVEQAIADGRFGVLVTVEMDWTGTGSRQSRPRRCRTVTSTNTMRRWGTRL